MFGASGFDLSVLTLLLLNSASRELSNCYPTSGAPQVESCAYVLSLLTDFCLKTPNRKGLLGPGIVFYLPCIDILHRVDLRTRVSNVRPQDVLTKDSVTITVNAVVYYCIYNPIDSIIQVDDFRQATQMISQVTLRNVVGSKTLNILLTSRQALSREIQVAVAGITARWGVRVERVDV